MLNQFILELPTIKDYHDPENPCYKMLEKLLAEEIKRLFSKDKVEAVPFGTFGSLVFPYVKMGAVDSLNLFSLDEFILFSFYFANRKKYKRALDLGGNIGLHSILMARCGFDVTVFEPDPIHFERLKNNLSLNQCANVTPINAAVSSKKGKVNFVRVCGNTLSNHIQHAKKCYGETEIFETETYDFKELISNFSLIKMDVEGHEKEILLSTQTHHFEKTDIFVEIGSKTNAEAIFNHLNNEHLKCFSQKTGWKQVIHLEEMPTSRKEGYLFITKKTTMPWPHSRFKEKTSNSRLKSRSF